MAAAAALQSSLHGDGVKLQPVFEEERPLTTLELPMAMHGASRMPGKEEERVVKAEAAEPSVILEGVPPIILEEEPPVLLEGVPQFQLQGSIPANWAAEVAEMAGRLTLNPKP